MKKKLISTILALTVALTSVSFASAATKITVGTPKITYVGCGFYENTEAHSIKEENPIGTSGLTFEWTAVKGASGYQQQINYKLDGMWRCLNIYLYDKDGNFPGSKCRYFSNYETRLKDAKAELKKNAKSYTKKGYIWRYNNDKNGKLVENKYTVAQYMKKFVPKTRASISAWQDDTVYKFRVRAYKTVNGKKVYGKWSAAATAKEKITAETMDYIFESVQKNVSAWATKNYPNFEVRDEREGAWDEAAGEYPGYKPEGGTYYITGSQRDFFSRYATPESVIKFLTESYEEYIADVSAGGGNESAYLFIRKMRNGSPEGLGSAYDGDKIFFKTWILVCF